MSIYDFQIKSLSGKNINFADFQGKIMILVNTASKCGLTPQYQGLQELYDKYKEKGLVIIGFPCNQFGNQEPGDAKQIQEECLVNYGVSFLITEKIMVNGPETHPIFEYLKQQQGGFLNDDIKWNFTKFLVDQKGKVVNRYSPQTEPIDIENDILYLLKKIK